MNIFYDEKLVKETDEEARLQAILDRVLEDPEALDEVSLEDQEKIMSYLEREFHKLEEEFESLMDECKKYICEL